jgi:hypothetical protein
LDLHTSARLAGHAVWLEERCFEVVGGWSTGPLTLFATLSRHHAWRAREWRERLPVLRGLPLDELVVAPGDRVAAAIDALGGDDPAGQRLEALGGLLLPALVAAHRAHLACTSVVRDGPTIRTLGIVVADLERDRVAVQQGHADPGTVASEDHPEPMVTLSERLTELLDGSCGVLGEGRLLPRALTNGR